MTQEQLNRLATEVTGEEQPEKAFSLTLESFLRRKMDQYRGTIDRLYAKYGLSFDAFTEKLGDELSLTWEHERDFMAWEEAVTNLPYFEKKLEQLKAYAE